MAEALKELLESDLLDEKTRDSIQEAWEANIAEAREEINIELREEFSARYENDKETIVEAMDNMLSEAIKTEITEFVEDRQNLVEARVAYKRAMQDHSKVLDDFVLGQLKEEVTELRGDRTKQFSDFNKLEGFVLKQLANEISEFNEDKKSLAEAKVKLVTEGRKKIAEAQQKFIKRSADAVEKVIENVLRTEMTQLKEDIKSARENNFGRKIFESFASEYMTSYLAEGTEIRHLKKSIEEQENKITQITEAAEQAEGKATLLENKIERDVVLSELLTPLAKNKRVIMEELLEGVQTSRLKNSFQKYLPAVLNETTDETSKVKTGQKATLTERTGDKVITTGSTEEETKNDSNIVVLRKLAGLN